jgi:hypothetical protein
MATWLSILTLYSWVLVGSVVYILIHIARFYEIKYAELYRSGPRHRTFYPLFLAPLLLFLIAAVRYAVLHDLAGDVWGDVAFFLGGVVLGACGYHLQRLMTGGHR